MPYEEILLYLSKLLALFQISIDLVGNYAVERQKQFLPFSSKWDLILVNAPMYVPTYQSLSP